MMTTPLKSPQTLAPRTSCRQGTPAGQRGTALAVAGEAPLDPIEELRVPVLLIHAKDDKVVAYKSVAASLHRYPTLTTAIFKSGGHMFIGNETAITKAFQAFTILGSAGARCTNM